MKPTFRHLVPVLCLAAALPAVRAGDDDKPVVKKEQKQIRILAGNDDGAPHGGLRAGRLMLIGQSSESGEKESVTFLGVETAPISATLTAQLGLSDGVGLVVVHLAVDSPAAGSLKEHDILLKLDDQLLIEQRQLSVLVRNHKEGDEVTLTYLRGGKQSTAKMKLGKHDVSKAALEFNRRTPDFGWGSGFGAGVPDGDFDVMVQNPNGSQEKETMRHWLPFMDGVDAPGVQRYQFSHADGPGDRNVSVTVNTGNSHVVLDDDKGSIELTIKEDRKELVAKNAKGEQIFSGPVNTPEERRKLPDEVRERLDRLEDSTQFNFKPDLNFKTETKIIRPRGQGIAMPPRAAPPARSPLFL